jgi:A/G-specific adenine glycosylase
MDRIQGSVAGARSALLRWYGENRRDLPWRRTRDPYAIWVSEAMLQQTRIAAALPYYERFLAAFPGIAELAEAPEEEVLGAWSGLGYYRRARALRAGARAVLDRHGGRVPSDLRDLLALPGVGPYTAGAIASIAFGLPEPALDGNVRRVLSRVLGRPESGAEQERAIRETARDLVQGPEPGDLNQALMELGALLCTPRSPRCEACPLTKICRGWASGDPERYPVRPRARRPSRVRVAAALVEHQGHVLLARRGAGTPFRGAWDLPAAEVPPGAEPATILRALLRRLGVRARVGEEIARARHSIVNRQLLIEVLACTADRWAAPAQDGTRWVRPGELGPAAISGATRKILTAAGRHVADPGPGAIQNRSQGGTHLAARPPRRSGIHSPSSGRSKR